MKNYLQMLYEFSPKVRVGFEKYLVVLCILFGVHCDVFAEIQEVDGVAATSTAKLCERDVTSLKVEGAEKLISRRAEDYVFRVNKERNVKLSVSGNVDRNVSVTWERCVIKPNDINSFVWETVDTKPASEALEVNDIHSDVLYRATFEGIGPGKKDQRALIVTGGLVPDIDKACPNEAVQLDVIGGKFSSRTEWLLGYGSDAVKRVKEYTDGTMTFTLNASDSPLKGYVVVKYDEFNCTKSATSPRFNTDNITVGVETDCKKECQSTSTGEYYVGTGFDPQNGDCNPGGKIPNDVYHFFDDYHIIFEENTAEFSQKTGNWDQKEGNKYWLGCNAEDFFGQKPDMDVNAGVVGKNNYMFAQGNINSNLFKLKFQVWDNEPNKGWEGVRGKTYQYKMRAYIQLDEGCKGEKWANAQFLARTSHGNQTWDITEVSAYDNSTSRLLGTKTIYGPNDAVLLKKDVIGEDYLNNMGGYDLVRFEVVFYGSFPMTPNKIDYFTFYPRFQQFECAKVAIDYISAEIENVCLSPNVVCLDSTTNANAAGFPKDSHYQWYREDEPGVWVLFEEGDDEKANIDVKVTKLGKQKHKLVVTGKVYGENGTPTDYYREMEFTVGGKNCAVPTPTAIEGSGVFCLPNQYGYKPDVQSEEATYTWELIGPDQEILYRSEDKNPHFLPTETGDSITISLDETAKEGEYKLILHTFGGGELNGTVGEQGNPVYLPLSVYRTPQISWKLVSDKYTGVENEENKALCASDVRREIVGVATNGFESPAVSRYTYTWGSRSWKKNSLGEYEWVTNTESDILVPRTHRDSADVHIEKIGDMCKGLIDSVEIFVTADMLGCASSDSNRYAIDKDTTITIDCATLQSELTTNPIVVPAGKDEVSFRLPIPNIYSNCDSDPHIDIEITPISRPEILAQMGVLNIDIYKSEEKTSKKLNVTLEWGVYDFKYTVTDGCGRHESCTVSVDIRKEDGPVIPCDSINDIKVNFSDFNTGSKCNATLDSTFISDLKRPHFVDQNDEKKTVLYGVYAGRRHFDTQVDLLDREAWKNTPSELAKFDITIGLLDEYEIDYTYILWKFTNAAGNSSYCVQEVWVRDTIAPYFDCGTIDPFVFRPVTKPGKCEIDFKDFWPELKAKNYVAYDSCPEPVTPIYGELHTDSVLSTKVNDTYSFKVGIADTIYWQFRDRHDNVKYCPQVINAFSGDSVIFDCDDIADVVGLANPGTCEVEAAKLNIPSPVATEPCPDENGNKVLVPGIGTRSDGKALTDPYPTGDTYITWLFDAKNSYSKTCVTHVFVKGNKHFNLDCSVLFPDRVIEIPECDSTKVKLEPQTVPDPCVPGYMAESVPYFTEYVKDANDAIVDTVYTLIDLKTENPYKFPKVGEWFVSWVFWDYTHNISDSCVQSIHLKDTFPPKFDCEDIPDTIPVPVKGSCKIPYEDLRKFIGEYYATEVCTGDQIPGVPYLLDTITGNRSEFPDEVSVGIYPIIWVFANDSLTTKETTCKKTLIVKSNFAPPFDCSKLSDVTLIDSLGLCVVPVDDKILPLPKTHDYCKVDYPVYGHGYIQLNGTGDFVEFAYFDVKTNKAVYKFNVPFGNHKLKWIFESELSTEKDSCIQNVVAHSDALDKFDCSSLADYVIVEYKGKDPIGPTFQEVKDAGLILPNIVDPCLVTKKLYTRSDSTESNPVSIYDNYPVNKIVTIKWYVEDITAKYPGNPKICYTKVEVRNGDVGIPECPDMPGSFLCEDNVPPAYSTLEEFEKNGGTVISRGDNVIKDIDPSKFTMTVSKEGDGFCDYYYIRTYHFADFRGQTASCDQRIHILDNEGPKWNKGVSTTDIFDCGVEVDFFPTDLSATDDCVNTTYSEYNKVNSLKDIVDGLFYTFGSTRSDDPTKCEYYNYEDSIMYVAVDRCNNRSDTLIYKGVVQDTFAPVLNVPQSWKDSMVVANYGVPCKFLVPDLRHSFPEGAISDKCDPDYAKYFTITQVPEAGSEFNPDLGTQDVTIYIKDPCNSVVSIKHSVYVPTRKEVISETMFDRTICIENNLMLKSSYIAKDTGSIWTYNEYTGTWSWKTTNKVVYDYYRGPVAKENLIFSNNPQTQKDYGIYFNVRAEADSLTFNDVNKTGMYSIVVTDTIRLCRDTASSFITVHSKPQITLDKGSLLVCERDSIHLVSDEISLYDKYNVEVDSVGEKITEEGWNLNGHPYKPMSLFEYKKDPQILLYYAINRCGTGFSSDTILLNTQKRMSPEDLMLVTDPQDRPRVLLGESASLQLVTKYRPKEYRWLRVRGVVDGRYDEMFDKEGNVLDEYKQFLDEEDEYLGSTYDNEPGNKKITLYDLGDTASYYVLLIDSVCPAVPSNVVAIDVVKQLPTAFTPQNSIGMNDKFVEGHHVIIFNRYGQKMVESDDGWDGTCRGTLVDPGVYFYEVIINEGQRVKGSIEVVYFK